MIGKQRESVSPTETNDHIDRAPANTVSKDRNGPPGASVQHFVRRICGSEHT